MFREHSNTGWLLRLFVPQLRFYFMWEAIAAPVVGGVVNRLMGNSRASDAEAASAELSRALAGADGRLGFGVRASGARWLGALTFTGRTVNDAEVFDTQSAVVGRFGGLVLTHPDYNVHLGANGTYVLHAADQSLSTALRYPIRFRERPELRVDSTRLVDTGAIDAQHAYSAGLEFG